CNLPIGMRILVVVDPYRTLPVANGRDERTSIRIEVNALFIGHTERDLLARAIGKTLPPDVMSISCISRQIHPIAIRRPGRIRTLRRVRTDNFGRRAPIKWNNAAGLP